MEDYDAHYESRDFRCDCIQYYAGLLQRRMTYVQQHCCVAMIRLTYRLDRLDPLCPLAERWRRATGPVTSTSAHKLVRRSIFSSHSSRQNMTQQRSQRPKSAVP
jgi:hypothetical protein